MAFDWGSAIGAAASLGSAYLASKGSKDAGKAAAAGSEAGNKVIWDMFQQNRADQQPFMQAGLTGMNEYMQMLGLSGGGGDPGQAYLQRNPDVAANPFFAKDPQAHYDRYGQTEGRQWGATPGYSAQQITDKLRSTPGYGFRFGEGQRAVESSAAAKGGLFSGAAAKSLARFGQGLADQTYGSHMDRLAALGGIAQSATNRIGDYGQNAATNVATGMQNAGRARASGLAGSADAWGQGMNNAAGFFGDWYGGR